MRKQISSVNFHSLKPEPKHPNPMPTQTLPEWTQNPNLTSLPVLSIRQPWAWFILRGGKNIENRSRRTHHRGWFLIHAAPDEQGEQRRPAMSTERSDTERLEWLERNYTFPGSGSVRFSFHPRRETWHPSVKVRFPLGFWSRNFDAKDNTNRWATLREAIDDEMRKPTKGDQP